MTPTQNPHRPCGLLEPCAGTTGTHGSEGAGAQQRAPATRRWRIQRHRKRGTERHYVYTYPSRKAVKAAMVKVRTWCRNMDANQPLDALLLQLNRQLRGWCQYFRPGVSHAAFHYLSHYTWHWVIRWLRRKHPKLTWKDLRRRYCDGKWWPHGQERELFDPAKVRTTRYRYRGTAIPTPWPAA